MAISLSKGGNISLNKEDPSLTRLLVGLAWDERSTDGAGFDLDASAFMLTESGKVSDDNSLIFYGGPVKKSGPNGQYTESLCGSVMHTGDNRTGKGDGDDEQIKIELNKVPAHVLRIPVTVTIHDAEARRQNFGMIQSAFIRVVNDETGREVARYDLTEDMSTETAMIFGEIYRHGGHWKFRAVGQGYAGGLRALALGYGVNVE
jgi:tellurium resistance protein TerD